MKLKLFSGLTALQLLAAATLPAQIYTFTVGNPSSLSASRVEVADHIGGEGLSVGGAEHSLEAYNLRYDGQNIIGMIKFNGQAGSILSATHYGLANTTDYLRLLKGYERGYSVADVVAEKVGSDGTVKSAVLLGYDPNNASIISAVELTLPEGYTLIRVFDVILSDLVVQNPERILCAASVDGAVVIVELLYNSSNNQYTVVQYKAPSPPQSYLSVHYVRSYHYSEACVGAPAFYGLATDGKTTSAFCYYKDPTNLSQVYERYELVSVNGIKGISGVQMNGSYGPNGGKNRIEMAFTDKEGGICIQQKDELVNTNWVRYYQFSDKQEFYLGQGRDGHGTKSGPGINSGMGYFLGAWMPYARPGDSRITALHFDGTNGDLAKPRVYSMSGVGILEGGSFPNTCYDNGELVNGAFVNNYTFIADRKGVRNGFQFGTGNGMANTEEKSFCAEPYEIIETREKRLTPISDVLDVSEVGPFNGVPVGLQQHEIMVSVKQDCPVKKSAIGRLDTSLLDANSTLSADLQHIRIDATGKAITSLRILSIDGRTITEVQNMNTYNYEHRFVPLLAPGIYVVHIGYSDHTTEAKKVSIR